jgi:hypothetical protein
MSDQPAASQQTGSPDPAFQEDEPPIVPPGSGWFQRLSSVLFIIFCFELGLFLLIYPWTDGWSDNYFAWAVAGSMLTHWHAFWDNQYVRGCISGVGVVNLWIAVAEVFRLFAWRTKH